MPGFRHVPPGLVLSLLIWSFLLSLQSWVDEKTPWTTRYGSIAGLAELGHDVSNQGEELGEGWLHVEWESPLVTF